MFILLADLDGTLHSHVFPTGHAVKTEEEAKLWVEKSKLGYYREYLSVEIVDVNDILKEKK